MSKKSSRAPRKEGDILDIVDRNSDVTLEMAYSCGMSLHLKYSGTCGLYIVRAIKENPLFDGMGYYWDEVPRKLRPSQVAAALTPVELITLFKAAAGLAGDDYRDNKQSHLSPKDTARELDSLVGSLADFLERANTETAVLPWLCRFAELRLYLPVEPPRVVAAPKTTKQK